MTSISDLTVLCVEDDKFSRDEMAHFLKRRVRKIFLAADGKEGLEAFDVHKPDIIIVDLLMPKMDGMEMVRRLRERHENLHCIIITSVNTAETVIKAVDLGVDGYIVKPVDFSELELKLIKIGDMLRMEDKGELHNILSGEALRNVEDSIKREFVKVVKEFTGKGPRETVVQVVSDGVKITSFGGLTKMETGLLRELKNFEMVKHMRHMAYEQMDTDIKAIIEKYTGFAASDMALDIDLRKGIEQISVKLGDSRENV